MPHIWFYQFLVEEGRLGVIYSFPQSSVDKIVHLQFDASFLRCARRWTHIQTVWSVYVRVFMCYSSDSVSNRGICGPCLFRIWYFPGMGDRKSMGYTITTHSVFSGSCWSYASERNIKKCLNGSTVLHGCSCRKTQPTCVLQTFMSTVMWPVKLGSAGTSGNINAFLVTA